MIAMAYGNVYVAKVALSNPARLLRHSLKQKHMTDLL